MVVMATRAPNYELIKLRIPTNFAFPMSKHVFDKQIVEKRIYNIKTINLKFADKITPPNGALVARWIRPSIRDGKLLKGFFTLNFIACPKENLTEIRRTLMKEYVPQIFDWINENCEDEDWKSEKHSFVVTLEDGVFDSYEN